MTSLLTNRHVECVWDAARRVYRTFRRCVRWTEGSEAFVNVCGCSQMYDAPDYCHVVCTRRHGFARGVAKYQYHIPRTSTPASIFFFTFFSFPLDPKVGYDDRGDKLRLINTSTTVGRRVWNARIEVSLPQYASHC